MDQYEDCGVFIGLSTVPVKQKLQKYFEKNIEKNVFLKLKDELKNCSFDKNINNESWEYFYRPKAYYLYGDFDLAIFSLIDDLVIGNRIFQSAHNIYHTKETCNQKNRILHKNYKQKLRTFLLNKDNLFMVKEDCPIENTISTENIQVITGINSVYHKGEGLMQKFKNIFNTNKPSLPLIAITKLKVNNGLLIGTGNVLLNLIKKFITNQFSENDIKIDFLLLDTFCNNELCLVIFSNSYIRITDIILNIREAKYEKLKRINNKEYNYILEECLINTFLKGKKEDKIKNAHIFSNTHTIFGYDLEYNNNPKLDFEDLEHENNGDKIKYFEHWDIKPGHLKSFKEELKKVYEKLDKLVHIPIGKGVIATKINTDSKKELPDLFLNIGADSKEIYRHFNKHKTFVNIKYNIPEDSETVEEDHFKFSDHLNCFHFQEKDLIDIRKKLNELWVSKVLQDRVIKMFRNYNDGLDNILFGYFVELREYLEEIKYQVEKFHEKKYSNREIHQILNSFVSLFEKAYNNRYQQSHRMLNSSDINLEHFGGIQQFVSAYNESYKMALSALGETKLSGIIHVSSFEGVESVRYDMRMNYFHTFQPELFGAVVVKEAANYYLSRMKEYIKNLFYEIKGENSSRLLDLTRIDEKGYEARKKIRNDLYSEIFTNESLINDEEKEIYNFLLASLNYKFYNNLFVDLITFRISYLSNAELYHYWFWNIFLQNASNYKGMDQLSESSFLQMYLRNICIYTLEDEGFIEKIYSKKQSGDIVYKYMKQFRGIVSNFIEKLFKLSKIKEFKDDIYITLQDIVYEWNRKANKIETFKDLLDKRTFQLPDVEFDFITIKKEIQSNKEKKGKDFKTRKKIKSLLNSLLFIEDFFSETDDSISNRFSKTFENNEIMYFNPKKDSPTYYTIGLTNAFLKYIYENNKNSETRYLRRCKEGTPIHACETCEYNKNYEKNVEKRNELLFDPLGGTFIANHENRKHYFKKRIILIKSLLDFSYKTKLNNNKVKGMINKENPIQ